MTWRTKTCRVCGDTKLLRHFYRAKSNADGYMTKCRECHKKYVYENRELKREYYTAKWREWFSNPENREKHYARNRRWRQTERGKRIIRECRKAWAVMHPEKHQEIMRNSWRRQNEKRRRRRAEARA